MTNVAINYLRKVWQKPAIAVKVNGQRHIIGAGQPVATVVFHNPDILRRLARQSSLAFGEGYMNGEIEIEGKLIDVLEGYNRTASYMHRKPLQKRLRDLRNLYPRRIDQKNAAKNAQRHYDIGNDLYRRMLDKRMIYTCAYWKKARNLDQAQEAKLDLVCRKINLKKGMTVLELGCGWGTFARYAAEEYGAKVTAVTVSREQVKLGRELCRGLPVEIKLEDYRQVTGKYDRVISIGIMEHVGYKNYRTYMETVDRTLKHEGIAFIHTIGQNSNETTTNSWTTRYIFPNSMLPSIAQLGKAMEGLFIMEDWHNFGPDYDKTLMAWHANFEKSWPELKEKYGDRFYRMWRYYLLSSAGGFRSRGRSEKEAGEILEDAKAVADAGAFAMVVEGTMEPLARKITEAVPIPTIGIGASPACDGQILVTEDLVGLFSDFKPRFVKRYAELGQQIAEAAEAYAADVRARRFPGPEHCFGVKSSKGAKGSKGGDGG